jgi:hypothetical protein
VKTSCRNDQLTEPKFVPKAADRPGFAGFQILSNSLLTQSSVIDTLRYSREQYANNAHPKWAQVDPISPKPAEHKIFIFKKIR